MPSQLWAAQWGPLLPPGMCHSAQGVGETKQVGSPLQGSGPPAPSLGYVEEPGSWERKGVGPAARGRGDREEFERSFGFLLLVLKQIPPLRRGKKPPRLLLSLSIFLVVFHRPQR